MISARPSRILSCQTPPPSPSRLNWYVAVKPRVFSGLAWRRWSSSAKSSVGVGMVVPPLGNGVYRAGAARPASRRSEDGGWSALKRTMLAARAYEGEVRFRLEEIDVPALGDEDALVR